VIGRVAVGEAFAISSCFFFFLSMAKIKPRITLAPSYKNFTFFQAISSIGILFYHLYELDQLGNTIPENELKAKMATYHQRYR
jgi:hypothetical protein